jgi:hypothetical protein
MSKTAGKARKQNKSIESDKLVLPIYMEQVKAELCDGYYGDDEEVIKERLVKLWTKIYKSKGYKNFELEFV